MDNLLAVANLVADLNQYILFLVTTQRGIGYIAEKLVFGHSFFDQRFGAVTNKTRRTK